MRAPAPATPDDLAKLLPPSSGARCRTRRGRLQLQTRSRGPTSPNSRHVAAILRRRRTRCANPFSSLVHIHVLYWILRANFRSWSAHTISVCRWFRHMAYKQIWNKFTWSFAHGWSLILLEFWIISKALFSLRMKIFCVSHRICRKDVGKGFRN